MNIEKLKTMDLKELPDLPVSERGAPYVVLDEFGKGPYFVTSEKLRGFVSIFLLPGALPPCYWRKNETTRI